MAGYQEGGPRPNRKIPEAGKGRLYANKNKQPGDKKPDFDGLINVDGHVIQVAIWYMAETVGQNGQRLPAAWSVSAETCDPQTGHRLAGGQPPQQAGYQPTPPQQGGYQPAPQGGYQQPPQQGGYQPAPPQQGGYQPAPQGGYQQPPQQAGYQPPQGAPTPPGYIPPGTSYGGAPGPSAGAGGIRKDEIPF
jgi:hypothetical protein